MPRSKTFKSIHEGPIIVTVPGSGVISFAPGQEYETDDPTVIAALSANRDLTAVKGKPAGKTRK